ncbi:MAG: hypothetical protein E5W70_28205 [Mesorhizobium sp.]|uniref:hypothetical protein n=1 Tax=Mesorhizobium sp. TaxID=1871066 RepID=UPI0011F63C4A|nr:hypothetical protein [Mesorhizobium sp.]TIT18719.1 MAG: hypothetical protein E5W70_28205 [Mesorhizobium sp.]
MKFSTLIAVSAVFFAGFAASQNNLAAVYIAVGVHALLYTSHAIEVKLNKLLDDRGLTITRGQIDRS